MEYFWSSIGLTKSIFGLKPKPHFPENQEFSLPAPILRYFLTNAFISNQIKLLKSCKIFRNYFRQFPGLKIDELSFTWFMRSKSSGINYTIEKNSLLLLDSFFEENLENFKQTKAKRLKFKNTFDVFDENADKILMKKISQTLIFEDVKICFQTINKDILMPLLLPSLKSLYLFSEHGVQGDILEFLLMNSPNLRNLKCTWQQNVNALKEATKIHRPTKLNLLYFYDVDIYPPESDVANFILRQMEPNGKFKFEGPNHDYTSEALVAYENEILRIVKSKKNEFCQFTFPMNAYGKFNES